MFRDREDAARRLAAHLSRLKLDDPLVLAIPRGGVVTGAVLADALNAELDVVLARKLRAPYQPEMAIGAIAENGEAYMNREAAESVGMPEEYLEQEKYYQMGVISRRKQLVRRMRPAAAIRGRSVILTDDGIATGATMKAAAEMVRRQGPRELIIAVPVAPADTLSEFDELCDKLVCLTAAQNFWSVGQFYDDFPAVDDDEMLAILRRFAPPAGELEAGEHSDCDCEAAPTCAAG